MEHGIDHKPAQSYLQLDPKLRAFLESMDEEDVETAKQLMKAYRNAGVVSRFLKWSIIVAFTVFMGLAGVFEKVVKLFSAKGAGL
jgi:hypothetical protein